MTLTNIVRPEPEHIAQFTLYFERRSLPGSGYGFACDAEGNLIDGEYSLNSYDQVKANLGAYHDPVVQDYSRDYQPPAYGTCACGRTVHLEGDNGHGIDCDCGRIYNGSGRELAPRSQWEERWDDDSTQPYNVEFGYVDT